MKEFSLKENIIQLIRTPPQCTVGRSTEEQPSPERKKPTHLRIESATGSNFSHWSWGRRNALTSSQAINLSQKAKGHFTVRTSRTYEGKRKTTKRFKKIGIMEYVHAVTASGSGSDSKERQQLPQHMRGTFSWTSPRNLLCHLFLCTGTSSR